MGTRVNAVALQANREQYERRCVDACEERLKRCLAEIERVADTFPAQEYLLFTVPRLVDNDPPQLSRERCVLHVIDELKKLAFFVKRCRNEDLFISWDPRHTPDPKHTIKQSTADTKTRHRRKLGVSGVSDGESDDESTIINYRPNSQFGNLFLRTQLMAKNPKYSRHTGRR